MKNDHETLFLPDLWEHALDKFARTAETTVQLFGANRSLVIGPNHPTPLFQLFEEHHYDPGLFAECARQCLAQTGDRSLVILSQFHGLTVVGTSLVLNGKTVAAAVLGFILLDFSQPSEIHRLSKQSGIPFQDLWEISRRQRPLPKSRVTVLGELLQILGDALLQENFRRRSAEEAKDALRQSELRLLDLNKSLDARVLEQTIALREQMGRLRLLSLELTNAEQRERKRLAAMLHDNLQQSLIAAKMQIEFLKSVIESEPAQPELETAQLMIEEAIETARDLTRQLRPPALYESGLGAALGLLGADMLKRYRKHVNVTGCETAGLSDDAKVLMYEAARELLMNSIKHAGAECVDVEVGEQDETLVVSVKDKGVGFDPNLTKESESAGYGLFSVRERIAALGGSMEIHSAVGMGTTIRILLPITDAVRPPVKTQEPVPAGRHFGPPQN